MKEKPRSPSYESKPCKDCEQVFPRSEFEIGSTKATRGRCRKCHSLIQRVRDTLPPSRFNGLKQAAKKRDIPVLLTFDEYKLIISRPCDYCEGPLARYGGGVDRIDSDKPYTVENSVPACSFCNELKGRTLLYEESKILGKGVKEIWQRRERLGLPPLMSHLQVVMSRKRNPKAWKWNKKEARDA